MMETPSCCLFPIQPLHTSRFLVSNIEARVKKLEEEKNLNASKGGFWDEFEVRSSSYQCGILWVIGIVCTRLVCTYPYTCKPCSIQNICSQYVLDSAILTEKSTRCFSQFISVIQLYKFIQTPNHPFIAQPFCTIKAYVQTETPVEVEILVGFETLYQVKSKIICWLYQGVTLYLWYYVLQNVIMPWSKCAVWLH